MPKLWNETIEEHRRAVREAVLKVTAALVAEQGLRGVTMSRIAEGTGIGRATLYKYFSDVESILAAWHERRIAGHLEELAALRDGPGSPGTRLTAVLDAYAGIQRRRHGHDPASGAALHRGPHVAHAERRLLRFLGDLLAEGVAAGEVRDDMAPEELAAYCLHALGAAGGLPSEAAARTLVRVTVDGLRPARRA
ncbi:TetR/AcrR family transcriptional regulator [Streptomyces bullii]|uniref:TetR/AcrR family transcriptional regulator n=1 Tax=Streptomyces bullii TaxID=349910 RepID=A0ABW0UNF8_9ACTN